jgi:hypothetical protein
MLPLYKFFIFLANPKAVIIVLKKGEDIKIV